ncbi:E3 ubiquitin-protein ligase TRIM21-like [Poecilia formosa]|uniref:E3 ubiquitin-protein ligase TRIM21-like n=1 Tax=Poecilia formosa TaxID=48698 RepID=A0A087X621_POEFO|nr:PREDICTED: E3 ubiquitin-protein ligase TRIM21-like [Poecilia formosa]
MATTKEDLWKTLENLTGDQFKHFKWLLQNDGNDLPAIPAYRLEKADRPDTVDLMVQKHGEAEAVRRSVELLKKIGRNDLAQSLSNTRPVQRGEFENGLTAVPSQCESERQKSKMREMKFKIRLKIKEREMKICEIQRSAELSRKSAEQQTAESQQTFRVLIQSVEESLSCLTKAVEEKQKTFQKQAERLIRELVEEISELTKSEAELDHLLLTEANLQFLQDVKTSDLTEFSVHQPSYGKTVMASVDKLKEMLDGEMKRFLSKAKLIRMQQFAVDVTLDPDTAHPNLVLSPDRKQVHCGGVKQNLPNNSKRFDTAANVLGMQSFSSGRVYFEAEVRGKIAWDVGVVYGSIDRKGSISSSPGSGHWAVGLRSGGTIKAAGLSLDVKPPLNKVGVFVDYKEGSIIFYNVDSAELIHQYSDCSFTEKLYPFFSPGVYQGGLNSTPLVICQSHCHPTPWK